MNHSLLLNSSDFKNGLHLKKVETHSHTRGASPCASISISELIKYYKQAKYNAIIITNHFNSNTVGLYGGSKKANVDKYIDFYKRAHEEGEKLGIDVWFGIEICLKGGPEDFLIFGADFDILYENPLLYQLTQQELFLECERHDCLLFQAHPFRSYCQPQNPAFLHGAEVFNSNHFHIENNDKALAWARKNSLLQSSGSDFHCSTDIAKGGVLVPETIHTIKEFSSYLRENQVTLICES